MRSQTLAAAALVRRTPPAHRPRGGPLLPRSPSAPTRGTTVKPRSDRWEAKVLKLTNARRHAHGRKPLKASRCADKYAERWTEHMATKRVLEHQSLDPFFGCPHTSSAGENIAYGYETPRRAGVGLDALEGSPGQHPEPALQPDRRLGLARHQRRHLRDPGLPGRLTGQVSSSVSSRRRTTSRPIAPITTQVDHRDTGLPGDHAGGQLAAQHDPAVERGAPRRSTAARRGRR